MMITLHTWYEELWM